MQNLKLQLTVNQSIFMIKKISFKPFSTHYSLSSEFQFKKKMFLLHIPTQKKVKNSNFSKYNSNNKYFIQ